MIFDPGSSNGFLPVPLAQAPALLSGDGATLHFRPDLLRPGAVTLPMPTGVSLIAAVREALRANGYGRRMPRGMKIHVAAPGINIPVEVPRDQWNTLLVREGMKISVAIPMRGGGGGKNPLATILQVVVIALAAAATWYLGGSGGALVASGWGVGAANFAAGMVSSLIMMGGMLLISAIAPPSTPKLAQRDALSAEKIWSIDGIKNKVDPYETVPLPLGRVRFAPRYFAQPYTYLVGNKQHARYLFGVLGRNKTSQHRIGDTDIAQFSEARLNVYENWRGESFEFFPSAVYQENLGITLNVSAGWQTRTTAQDTTEIQWEVHFTRGLGTINREGQLHQMTVSFEAQYRKVGETDWKGAFGNFSCNGGTATIQTPPEPPLSSYFSSLYRTTTVSTSYIYIDADGNVSTSGGVAQIGSGSGTSTWARHKTGEGEYSPWQLEGTTYSVQKDPSYSGDMSITGNEVVVTPGIFARSVFSVSGATTTPIRQGYNLVVQDGQYDFRLRRLTGNANPDNLDTTVLDESTWPVLKSVRSGPVLRYDGVPYTVFELDIQATERLSGHIDEFNAIFESICPTWNGSEWIDAPSNNPASLCMMLGTSEVMNPIDRATMDDMDLPAWQGYYEWCAENEWAFNSVQTSTVLCRDIMQPILSSGRGDFSFNNNGQLSVVWDSVDKPTRYPYGPRNSWGFKARKNFLREPAHGLRYRFLNELRDYQEDERIVYADGYSEANAVNIIDAEADGVTNPDLIYKIGRIRLAESVWRTETYEFQTDFSFLCVNKGDRLSVTHDVPMWGLSQARVVDIIPAEYIFSEMNRAALVSLSVERQRSLTKLPDGRPLDSMLQYDAFTVLLSNMTEDDLRGLLVINGVKDFSRAQGIIIDDYVSMDGGKDYALKYFPTAGSPVPYSLRPEDGTTNRLFFQIEIPAVDAPAYDGLIHFGESGNETHDVIVVGIETQDNLCAKIICQDYSSDKIYAAMTGPIQPWNSNISLPSRWQLGKPATPLVGAVRTDEYVLLRLADGSLIPRIQVIFSPVDREGVTLRDVKIEVRKKGEGSEWIEAGTAPAASGFVYAQGVEEGVDYELRIMATSTIGASSDYSPVYTTKVIGRTTPPPPPTAVHIDGTRIWWEMGSSGYPVDIRGWEVWMGFGVDDSFSYAKNLTSPYTPTMEFDISSWSGWARSIWVRTIDDIGLTSDPVRIAINLGDRIVDNVIVSIPEGEGSQEQPGRNWPGEISGGSIIDGKLIPNSNEDFWLREDFWATEDFWQTTATVTMTYKTSLEIPQDVICSYLSISLNLPLGGLGSLEYRFITSGDFWNREDFWNTDNFWQVYVVSDWQPMPSKLWIQDQNLIEVRLTTVSGTPSRVDGMEWVFDVEDEIDYANDLVVPAEGIRVPLKKNFRQIKNIAFGQEYHDGSTATQVVWLDKGIVDAGYIVDGPLIQCRDKNDNPVAGVVDVTMQGIKGECIHG